MLKIRETEEFELRRKRLGKPKNRRREYALLEKILVDPFPMQLGREPITGFPDIYGWLYYHIRMIHPNEPIYPKDLANYITFLEKVILVAWDCRHKDGKRIQPEPRFNSETIRARIPYWAHEIGLEIDYGSTMTLNQAQTILHYLKFDKPDYDGSLWSARAPLEASV